MVGEPPSHRLQESLPVQGIARFPGQRGKQKKPTKILVTMRFSREVLDYFKASGEGWQTRINEALCQYVKQNPPEKSLK